MFQLFQGNPRVELKFCLRISNAPLALILYSHDSMRYHSMRKLGYNPFDHRIYLPRLYMRRTALLQLFHLLDMLFGNTMGIFKITCFWASSARANQISPKKLLYLFSFNSLPSSLSASSFGLSLPDSTGHKTTYLDYHFLLMHWLNQAFASDFCWFLGRADLEQTP